MRSITIIDVCRALRIEPEPRLTWPVGAAVRVLYETRHGALPQKALRTKTSGAGSHCLAVYPESMWGDIERIIRLHDGESRRQGDMFD
jgi:hypothetical protein